MMVSANSAIWVSAEPSVAGAEALEEELELLVEARPAERRERALAGHVERQQQDFEAAGDEHAPGRGVAGAREQEGDERASP